MWTCYLMALAPIIAGGILWVKTREFVWQEWLVSSAVGFVTVIALQAIAVASMVADVETWSGEVTEVVKIPRWVEEYQEMHTRTVGSGKDAHTEIYFTTEHRTHPEHWKAARDFGRGHTDEIPITQKEHDEIAKQFGGVIVEVRGSRPGFDSGDRNDYHVKNTSGIAFPTTKTAIFENRVRCSPSLFSYQEVPKGSPVHEWPANPDWKRSGRLLGTATRVPIADWDRMCSRLGPRKKVNVIAVGFMPGADSSAAQLQEAKWVGGKKNDLVICYGGDPEHPSWARSFGWTESMLVKRNLETIVMESGFKLETLPLIEEEISKNYVIKNWSDFDHITVEPPWWAYALMMVVVGVSQTIVIAFCMQNDLRKGGVSARVRGILVLGKERKAWMTRPRSG